MQKKRLIYLFVCFVVYMLLFGVQNKDQQAVATDEPPPYKTGISSPGAVPVEPPDEALRNAGDLGYFEDKVDWLSLNIREPRTAWEHLQFGLYQHTDLLNEEEAIKHFKIAIEMDEAVTGGKMIMPHARLCEIYLEQEQYDDVIKHCTRVAELDPALNGPNDRIGKAYAAKKDFPNAIKFFEKELEVQGGRNQIVFFELAEIYLEMGQKQKALKFFEEYLEEAKWHSDTYPLRIEFVKKEVEELKHELEDQK